MADTPRPSLSIETATEQDLPAVLALYESAGITGDKAYTLEQARAQLARFALYPFYRLFVARRDGKVVGTYEFLEMENLAKAGAKTAIVEDVAVDPRIQRAGIGRALMEHARALAFSRGCYKLMLSSNNKRKEAHAFYASLGFLPHGVSFIATPPEPR